MFYQPLGHEDDQFSSGIYWCTRTHEGFGPDGEPAAREQCCQGRSCFGQ
jgi:hypothetical protein